MDPEALRHAYRPDSVGVLLVDESTPRSSQPFYEDGVRTRILSQVFADAWEMRFEDTSAFLRFFREQGFYLDEVSHVPLDDLPRREREQVLRDSIPDLAERLRELRPDVVVAIRKKIEPHVLRSIELAGLVVPLYVLPFPGQGHQKSFREGLTAILRSRLRKTA